MDVSKYPELGAFQYHGLDVAGSKPNAGGNLVFDCPFCSKEQHFQISTKKANIGQFRCLKCDVKGNRYNFLQLVYDFALAETTDGQYKHLASERKTKFWQAFKEDGWAYDADREAWLIAIPNSEGSIVNLKVYRANAKPKIQNTTGCAQHFAGLDTIEKDGPIYICEGEPDRAILKHIYPTVDDRPHSILAIPGIDTFANCAERLKTNIFANRDVVLLWDAGERELKKMTEAASLLQKKYHARSVLILHWPESIVEGHDINDQIDQKGEHDGWAKISSWLRPHGSRANDAIRASVGKMDLSGVIKAFRDSGVHVNRDFSDAITIVVAAIASIRYGGIPLWIYLVGPPGKGKSLILESTIQSEICHYQTDLKYTTLVSGFKTDPDPSLLAQLNGRILVIKDYTTILDKNEVAQKELLSLLRDAYDGQVERTFGNGVVRIYPDPASGQDRCYFGIVAGVTPKIHIYNKAALGERFIKIDLGKPVVSEEEVVRRAIEGANQPWLEVENADKRQAAMNAFFATIAREPAKPASVTKYINQIIALAQFAAVARSRPERERSTGDLLYDAAAESASRLAKQFTKLAQSIAAVRSKGIIDDECMRLVRKTAWCTAHGWHRNVYEALWNLNDQLPTCHEIAREVKPSLSVSSTQRVLTDLRDLGICDKSGTRAPTKKGGRPADQFKLSKHGVSLIVKSKLFG